MTTPRRINERAIALLARLIAIKRTRLLTQKVRANQSDHSDKYVKIMMGR